MNNNILVDILRNQVAPALGCTEPGAVAYGAARAKEILGEDVKKAIISVDKNILKNGMEVGIPGTKEKGLAFAAALAFTAGKSEYKLEVLKDAKDSDIKKAYELIDKGIVSIDLNSEAKGLYVEVEVRGNNGKSKVIIKDNHLNIVFESKDDKVILSKEQAIDKVKKNDTEIKYRIKEYLVKNLIDFANSVELERIAFIEDGIRMNNKIADVGISGVSGIGIGRLILGDKRDPETMAKAYTAAASEARMSGYPLPVMSSAGSGNHGLVAILPISIMGRELKIDRERIIRAVALSHLVTIYVKVHTGALSPVCGCGVAAGVGCSAGLTYLMGGSIDQIKGAILNMIAGISGMICDGAKLGCSCKLSVSVTAALDASKMALKNLFIPYNNGILSREVEDAIRNLGRVSSEGMNNTDSVILDIMLKKCK